MGADFELRDHTADVAVEARGPTLEAVFSAAADGLAAAQCDAIPDSGERFSIDVDAESREALLFDYLDELIYERDVRSVLPVENRVEAIEGGSDGAGWTLSGSVRGVPLDRVEAREVKAVTYSEMRIEEREDEWYAYVVLDV
ncbi:archease [Halalkalicoccus ordinarius]|uniref:archease n=1 Tax=Halalkalicoccus ordinarius TaxID=3116651 RepID=UPI00300F171C